jgi:hypothetical protein
LKSAQEQQLRETLKPDSSEANPQTNNTSTSPRNSTATAKGKNSLLRCDIFIQKFFFKNVRLTFFRTWHSLIIS